MSVSLVAESALSLRVRASPSMPGSWMSMRMRRGANSRRTVSASSASAAVRTVYPSPARSTRISFRLTELSSTIRIRSPATRALRGPASAGRHRYVGGEFFDERRGAQRLEHDGLRGSLEPLALLLREVLHGPHDDRRPAAGGALPEAFQEFESVDLRHGEVENHGSGSRFPDGLQRAFRVRPENRPVAELVQRLVGELEGLGIVVDDQDRA